MKRVNEQKTSFQQLAKKVLSWIMCAKRPLTTLELQHALAVEVGDSDLDEDNFEKTERIVSVCAGLVTIQEGNEIVEFVHYTTQEYFERTQEDWFPNAESEITIICVTYLSFNVFRNGIFADLKERLHSYPFYGYATQNWGHHARKTLNLDKEVIDFLRSQKTVEGHSYYSKTLRQMTGLHLAAYFGLEKAVKALLQEGIEINAKDSSGRTPLSYAAEEGHDTVVELLLVTGKVDKDWEDNKGRTPLSYAAVRGHESIAQLILRHNATNLDSRDSVGQTPLSDAAARGYVTIVKALLLENNVNPDAKDRDDRTPLLRAAFHGHEAVVELLLQNGKVDADSKDDMGRTPLWWAIHNGYEAVVKLLLNTGRVNAHPQDIFGRTPLFRAAEYSETAVKLLQG